MSASSTSFQRRLVYIVFLVGIGLLHVATARQDPPCNCTGGCGTSGIYSNSRRKVNVAYGKSASISSVYGSGKHWEAGPACMAVNGRTSTIYSQLSESQPNCVHSARGDYQASWEVDLGDNYFVESITIYGRRDYMDRMALLTVEVDRATCYDFPEYISRSLFEQMNITCQQPLTGRYVTIRKRQRIGDVRKYINICEVQVWTCASGTYGENCGRNCGQCRGDGVCNIPNGTCPDSCQPGFDPNDLVCKTPCKNGTYGESCASTCGRCRGDGVCNKGNGTCPDGCQPGFDPSDSRCKTPCDDGTYGQSCASICGQCRGDGVCNKGNGTCPDSCQPGFHPNDLFCRQPCADGMYGENCASTCGQCRGDGVCNKGNGACPDGCQPGFDPNDPVCKRKLGDENDSWPLYSIVGAGAGGVVFFIVIIVIVVVFVRLRSRKEDRSTSPDTLTPSVPTTETPQQSNSQPAESPEQAVYIYSNVRCLSMEPQAAPPSAPGAERPTPSGAQADRSPPLKNRDMDPELMEAGSPLNDGEEEEEVYASFKATQPQLDTVQKYLVDRLTSGQLAQEFASLGKGDGDAPTQAGSLRVNWKKNRFASILPYDHNRVVLTDGYTGHRATDFVNASYISGYRTAKQYIASQGPRDNTVWDMWRTIWQDNIVVIVMLTRLQEAGRDKCYQYWPEEEGMEKKYGPVTVTTRRVRYRDTFIIRTFSLYRNGQTREVTQYHYMSWPDHGAPTVTSLVSFWRRVSCLTRCQYTDMSGNSAISEPPVLVHCSAGVGRTGTYIGLDLGMDLAVSKGHIDLHELVRRLRAERVWMVQAVDQYTFLYKALLEAYTARDTILTVDHFDQVFPQHISSTSPQPRVDREFQTLMQLQKLTPGHSCDTAGQPDNMAKNRNPQALPADDHLVYLTEHVPGRNQYINAVYMRTFHQAKGSILTQCPLPSTVVDFWRLVYGNDVTTIVSLTSPDEECKMKDYCVYWPREEGQTLQSGPYTLTLNKTQQHQGYSIVTHTLTLAKNGESTPRTVQLYQYTGWRGEVMGGVGEVLYLMDTLLHAYPPTTSTSAAPPPPLLLQCSDGVTKSGMFSALYDVITRVTYDREVDVFMSVRHVQSVMPAAVTSLEQYRYCYEVVQTRVHDISVYGNA